PRNAGREAFLRPKASVTEPRSVPFIRRSAMSARHPWVLLLTLILAGVLAGPARSQGQDASETAQVMRMLLETVETKDFINPMTFKDALQLMHDKYAAKGKDLPIVFNSETFKSVNVD